MKGAEKKERKAKQSKEKEGRKINKCSVELTQE